MTDGGGQDKAATVFLPEKGEISLTYRKMRAEDYDAVFALWQSTPGMGLNSLDDSREGIARYLDRNPETCFVAEEADRICGTVLSGHDGRRGYFYHTAVVREKQGQGVGSRLVELAVEALKAQGITKAALVAFSENESGNAFWERRGFTLREDLSYRNLRLSPL